jgi:hypothetical protein
MRIEMPFLLQCGMALSTLITMLGTAILGLFGLALVLDRRFTIDGRPVSREAFLHQTWWMYPALALICIVTGAIAYGLRRERAWSRLAILSFWVVNALCGTFGSWISGDSLQSADVPQFAAFYLVLAGIASWYLYAKRDVRAYYAAIARVDASG